MHRRQFIGTAAGALLLPKRHAGAAQSESPPVATPQHHGRPRPIVLGDGIELIDYRIYPSRDVPRIIGEILNTRDDMIDSPGVSIAFPELDNVGLAYASPALPVLWPGESNMIFGTIPIETGDEHDLSVASYGLCSPVEQGQWSARMGDASISITINDQKYWADSLNVWGAFINRGNEPVESTAVQGLIRDESYRYAGTCTRGHTGDSYPGGSTEFFLWASMLDSTLADPYTLTAGSTNYSLEARISFIDYFTAAACSSLLH